MKWQSRNNFIEFKKEKKKNGIKPFNPTIT